ncbi:hypothetical protein BG07_5325 [Bacillus pseudomycoides]|uniref:hypothetical protein n=1 Tax=Bacillus TaxID=1386 RepID=UPI00037687C1|nr:MULTISPECIES: hypothetical protein [Bacillus]AIK39675.1 hypothetical protein DJ92_4983 [Bacillus pseudomycoides]AJI19012.1 hypothetical protein BG07_5325 [Bacillus pseudomycoides]MCX2825100.1 hypothetical protein [Bacillus sp. DHT2]PEB39015.1 hypothetical protein COO06_25345 [Bacillus pseudomycoides]PEE06635.1 hypothetical protein CON86_07420 [Bacillus pseudomycoides]
MVLLAKYKSYIVIGCVSIGIFVTGIIGWNGTTEAVHENKNVSSFEVREHEQGIHWIYDLYGIENQIGFIKKPIVVNKGETYDWFLWGTEKQIANEPLKITAIHPNTKQEIQIADIKHMSHYDQSIHSFYEKTNLSLLPLSHFVKKNNIKLISHQAISMKFPENGKWNLYVVIGDKKLPPISIEVTNQEEKLTPLK